MAPACGRAACGAWPVCRTPGRRGRSARRRLGCRCPRRARGGGNRGPSAPAMGSLPPPPFPPCWGQQGVSARAAKFGEVRVKPQASFEALLSLESPAPRRAWASRASVPCPSTPSSPHSPWPLDSGGDEYVHQVDAPSWQPNLYPVLPYKVSHHLTGPKKLPGRGGAGDTGAWDRFGH